MRPIIGAGGLGIGERIRYREVDSAWADIQADLNSADYDGVALEYGVWTVALNANLTIPDGKVLMGYRWPGDLEAQTSIQVTGANQITVDGRIENLNIEFDAARTADLLVGDEGRAKNIRVYTSDSNYHNYFAFSGVWKEIDTFEVIDVKGVDVNGALVDPSTGPMRIRNFNINATNNANAQGIQLRGATENVKIELGTVTAYRGIFNDSCDHITIDTVSFTDCDDAGIYNQNTPEYCTYRTLRFFIVATVGYGLNGTMNNSTCEDFRFYGDNATAAQVPYTFTGDHNTISDIYSERASYVYFLNLNNSEVSGITVGSTAIAGRYGIYFAANDGTNFTNLTVEGVTSNGIYVNNATLFQNCNISNVVCRQNGGYGIRARDGRNNNWTNIHAYSNTLAGISIEASARENWSQVYARQNTQQGIYVQVATESRFSQLFAYSNTGNGVHLLGTCARCTFADITALGNAVDVVGANIAAHANRSWIRQINAGTVNLGTYWYTGKDRGGFTLDAAEVVNCPVGGGGFGPYYPLAADVGAVGGTTLLGTEQEFDEPANGRIRYIGRYSKIFDVIITLSAVSSVANDTVSAAISLNNASVAASENAHTAAAAGTYVTLTVKARLTLVLNDTIGLKVGSTNAGANITVHRIHCQAIEAEDL